ncbi:MAG: aminomethyl transferase family protein [Rhizobiales bacterium]|nr:aminomethyl transferase family protein [Hyphomicrobiales bacterium]
MAAYDHVDPDGRSTVLISARRFEQSPYLERYDHPEVVRGVYAGRFFAMFYGDDPTEKYWVLRRKAAMYDVPERPVEISGRDAVPFLEKVFARHVCDLKQGRGRYAIACTPQGGVFMDGLLFKLSQNRFWYVQSDGALETWLIAHSEGFDITVSDPKSRVLQIQGPASVAVMRDASRGAIDENMGYFHAGFFDLGGQELYVSRTGWTGELGFEVYSQGDKTDHHLLWDHLMEAGQPHGLEFSGSGSMEIRRLEAGILDNITDMDMSMTPFQAGLARFIDMDKDDFVGRTALVVADRRTLLYGLKCSGAKPIMNDEVLNANGPVGRVTAGAWSPYLDTAIGYVRFNLPGDWAGQTLSLQSSNGQRQACEIVDLPFYDPQKRIARGLDKSIP